MHCRLSLGLENISDTACDLWLQESESLVQFSFQILLLHFLHFVGLHLLHLLHLLGLLFLGSLTKLLLLMLLLHRLKEVHPVLVEDTGLCELADAMNVLVINICLSTLFGMCQESLLCFLVILLAVAFHGELVRNHSHNRNGSVFCHVVFILHVHKGSMMSQVSQSTTRP